MTQFEKQVAQVAQAINDLCMAAYDYETEHKDAGDNYSHMPCEQWSDSDTQRLADWLSYHNVKTSLDVDEIADIMLENFYMGHIFSDYGPHIFEIAAFPVGEIETQIDREEIANAVAFDVSDEIMTKATKDCDAYIKSSDCGAYYLAYQATDCIWFAHISLKTVKELIADEEKRKGE